MTTKVAAKASGPTGTQTIERAFTVLRVIASQGNNGGRLTDIVAATGLSKPTVRRILAAMIEERVIEQDPNTRLYFLGQEMYVFGTVASDRYGIHQLAIPSLVRLAEVSEDTVFLSVPSGNDAVCLHRELGAFPIRNLALTVGQRYPLGVSAGGLALLAAMPDNEVERIIAANTKLCSEKYPAFTRDLLLEVVERTRNNGYATVQALIVPGSWGIGVVVPDDQGRPLAAISIAAITSRVEPRQQELVKMMYEERDRLCEAIRRAQTLERREPRHRAAQTSLGTSAQRSA
jgi:DNA-binding IclR family transcriptional regulator